VPKKSAQSQNLGKCCSPESLAAARLAPSYKSAAGLRKNPSGMPNRCARALTEASERFNCIAISKGEPFVSARSRNTSSSSGVHRPPLLFFISPSASSRAPAGLPKALVVLLKFGFGLAV
jgi:hypothetical protein